jgi:hypothetical protein
LTWGAHPGLVLRAPVISGEDARRAVRDLVDFSRAPAVAAPLTLLSGVRAPHVEKLELADTGPVELATYVRDTQGKDKALPFALGWVVRDGEIRVAASPFRVRPAGSTSAGSQDVRSLFGTGGPVLGDDPRIARALAAVGARAAFMMVVQPSHVDPVKAGPSPGPIVVAFGRGEGPEGPEGPKGQESGRTAWLRVETSYELLRDVIRLNVGL